MNQSELEWWDMHVHATLRPEDLENAMNELHAMRERGAGRVVLYCLVGIDETEADVIRNRVPVREQQIYAPPVAAYMNQITTFLTLFDRLHRPSWLQWFPQLTLGTVVTPDDLLAWWTLDPFAGIKVALSDTLGDADSRRERSERLCETALTFCRDHQLPINIHVELERDPWLADMLEDYMDIRTSIAHLGYSRRRMAALFERRQEHLYADVANLADHILERPASYRDFLHRYRDRILLGSDAFLGDLSASERHARTLYDLLDFEDYHLIAVENPRRFLDGNA